MPTDAPPRAQVVLIGGASGSGKSRLAERSGLPLLRLDDFYRSGDDPALPRLDSGEVDWDHPGSWHADRALAALDELSHTGRTEVPVYDIAANGPVGTRLLELGGATRFVAEGVFVAEVIAEARRRGLLADAVCVRRSRWLSLVLRFVRDVREHRKPLPVLVRRGVRLARQEPAIVARLADAGFRPASVRGIRALLARP
ncbi:ATP-binding protein [Microbacterium marinilacus]|uniref:Uridine kinase n=1 Tax=Microbacterium marinilacus TaxID=415209 RepID=A0ABP7BV77_9MICO|nr:ATP-binding protein [Microbacterium marinilacus]MBY0688089.1 ATP-binding protein [Microbacterium marinilacus]